MIRPGRPKLERKVALEAPPPPPTRSRAAIPVRKQTRKRFRENRLNLNFHVVPPVDLNYLYVPGKYVTGKKQVTVGVVVRLFVCLSGGATRSAKGGQFPERLSVRYIKTNKSISLLHELCMACRCWMNANYVLLCVISITGPGSKKFLFPFMPTLGHQPPLPVAAS
jgi:hypothetical protein